MAANHGELKPYKVGHAPLFGQLWLMVDGFIYIYVKTNDFYQFLSISMVDGGATILAGWWFGTFFIFPYIGNIIIPTDELIFFRGVQTTNQ